jgi:hypothetical protein
MTDEIIYREWPEETVMAELRVFKDRMYDGAGPEELSAGLFAIDFLTRASALSDTAEMLVGAAVDEARMRIDLMIAKEQADMDQAQLYEHLRQGLRRLLSGVRQVQKIIETAKGRFETVAELQEYLERINWKGRYA